MTATGTLLVLLSWTVLVCSALLLGLAPAVASGRHARLDELMRASLWWGLSILVLLAAGLSLLTPMRSGLAATVTVTVVVLLGIVGVLLLRRAAAQSGSQSPWRRPSGATVALLATLGAVVVYFAARALGPVTNYDSGLYHLSAIAYVGDYGTVPGLANLHFPLGYANSLFPFAALLGNGPWDGVGYRLANGLIVALVCIDLALRLVARRWSWGTWLLLAAGGSVFIPMVALADFWVTSPTSDTTILLLTVVSAAYLADALSVRRLSSTASGVVGVLTILMVTMRPTMAAFTVVAFAVLLIVSVRRNGSGWRISRGTWLLMGGYGAIALVVEVLRDYRLSGWFVYPLSLLPLGAAWQAADPVGVREATLSAARDPSRADHGIVAHSWGWILPWLERSITMWETWFLLLGTVLTVVALLVAKGAGRRLRWRLILAVMLPSAAASAAWFLVSPPSYRFAWGPLFTLFLIPLSAALHALQRAGRWRSLRSVVPIAVAVVLVLVTGYSAVARTPWGDATEQRQFTLVGLDVPYAVAPVPLPSVEDVTTTSGLVVRTPIPSDQCWAQYPLCAPAVEPSLALRGPDIADGFVR